VANDYIQNRLTGNGSKIQVAEAVEMFHSSGYGETDLVSFSVEEKLQGCKKIDLADASALVRGNRMHHMK
jgi:hypothetical protein